MSESDSIDHDFEDFLFHPVEGKKIVLDAAKTFAKRQKNAESKVQIKQMKEQPVSASAQVTERSEHVELNSQSLHSAGLVQEIKYIHPGRSTFNPSESCCIFSEDILNIKDFRPSKDGISHVLFELSDSVLRQFICRNQLKRAYQRQEIVDSLCLYLFFLTSVHKDKRTAGCSANTILYIKEDWFPSVDNIFIVFINWGIRSEYLDVESIEEDEHIPFEISKKSVAHSRKLDYNIEKILQIIGSSAREIAKASTDDKLDKLIYILVLSALEPGAHLVPYSRCICSLLYHVPKERWNYNRVQKIAELLFCEGTEDYHNLLIVCNSLLVLNTQAREVARFLASMTLNKLLSAEKKKEPLDCISCQDVLKLLSYYSNLHELKFYQLYISLRLVDFCFHSDYNEDKLSLDEMHAMISWLGYLGGNITTILDSVSYYTVKELISRYLSSWRIMAKDIEEIQTHGLCSIISSEGFDVSEGEENKDK